MFNEAIERESRELKDWVNAPCEPNIEQLRDLLIEVPQPCQIMSYCESHDIKANRCACIRTLFENEAHFVLYQNMLELFVFLLITDTLLSGRVCEKN